MREILTNALIDIGIAMLIALGGAAIAFLKAKIVEANTSSDNSTANRIRWEVAEAVEDAVTAVNQTFVEELKNKNLFDKEKQEEAFERARNQNYYATILIENDLTDYYLSRG